jgi:aspartyl protease family protein
MVMKPSCRFILEVVVLIILFTCSAYGEVYRWKDRTGKYIYTTTLPTSTVENIEVKKGDTWVPYRAEMASSELTSHRVIIDYEPGSAILIDVLLNNRLTRKFIVDTGATYTVISSVVAAELGIKPSTSSLRITLQTANGLVTAPKIKIDSIKVGEAEARNIEAAIHDFTDSPNVNGLLGLSFLNKFRVNFDNSRGRLILEGTPVREEDCVTAEELVRKGQALNNGSNEEASYYKKALDLCKSRVEAHYYLGVVYFKQKNYPSAILEAQELLRANAHISEARYLLGVIYLSQRNYQQAEIELRRALESNPKNEHARTLLNEILAHK